MILTTDNLTADLKRRPTLQGRYGRHVEQSWVGRRATKIIRTLEDSETVRDQEYVSNQRQLTLDILEGRRPQAGLIKLTEHFVVHEKEVLRDEQTDSRNWQETLEILEGRRPPPLARCTYSEFAAWHCRHLATQAGQ
ncbi:hypothetical protein BDZ89DRAFT_1062570 [Hymenopellis radicata]|nr:hypothetical protein BDZ89DRAFT_1062570 [Hymenopellis radicata]